MCRIVNTAIAVTKVGNDYEETPLYIGVRKEAMTPRACAEYLRNEGIKVIDVIRVETYEVA